MDTLDQLTTLPEEVKDIYFNEASSELEQAMMLDQLEYYGYKAQKKPNSLGYCNITKIPLEEYIEDLVSLNLNGIDISSAIKSLSKEDKDKAIFYLKFAHSGEHLQLLTLINALN